MTLFTKKEIGLQMWKTNLELPEENTVAGGGVGGGVN